MLFSKKEKLQTEYYEWLEEIQKNRKIKVKDNPLAVMNFLEFKELLKEDIKREYFKK